MAGRPTAPAIWVDKVLKNSTAGHFPGDEDTGSMAAWFIFSAIGFYPSCPGKPEYVLGSPLFDKVTLHLANGKSLEIEASRQSGDAIYVAKISVDGNEHPSVYLPHQTILRGGRIIFSMQNRPAASWVAS